MCVEMVKRLYISCYHCKTKTDDPSLVYKMMLRSNPTQDTCTLKCPNCKKEIDDYGYDEYYTILFGLNDRKKEQNKKSDVIG